ncbi:MAG: hypothetical protein R3E82_15870 [Pseudomonadales bacterium]|nr:hypothetical protein [Pseudomonadales bacterium]
MPRLLIQTLAVVFFITGMLLALESRATTSADPHFAGDRADVHSDALASAIDPEIPLPSKADHSVDTGYRAPQAPGEANASPAQSRRIHFARAPPGL